jgi:hypothetical protein
VLEVIGGAAAMLQYGASAPTKDINTTTPSYVSRTVSIGLKKLVVHVPDRYDLALSKTIRGYDNDLQVIKEMHEKKPFSLKRPVALFETEMDGAVTKDRLAPRLNVAVLVATLFGDEEGEKVALRWGVAVPRIKKR